jgi:hypothetical protein
LHRAKSTLIIKRLMLVLVLMMLMTLLLLLLRPQLRTTMNSFLLAC